MKMPKGMLFRSEKPAPEKPEPSPLGRGEKRHQPEEKATEKAPDGRLIGEQNELSVLHAIHRFGHATSHQIAGMTGLVRRSVQRTLKRLQKQNAVSYLRLPDGDPVYLLRQSGADRLSAHLGTEVKRTNSNQSFVSSPIWKHRKLANNAAAALASWSEVLTEREIQKGRNPNGRREILPGKVPDLLASSAGEWTWIEVEQSWKKQSDYRRLIQTLEMLMKGRYNQAGPRIGNEPILRFGLLAADFAEAQKHVRRLLRHYNAATDEPIPDRLIEFFSGVDIYWFDRDELQTRELIQLQETH